MVPQCLVGLVLWMHRCPILPEREHLTIKCKTGPQGETSETLEENLAMCATES
jgi:hypothetical protein